MRKGITKMTAIEHSNDIARRLAALAQEMEDYADEYWAVRSKNLAEIGNQIEAVTIEDQIIEQLEALLEDRERTIAYLRDWASKSRKLVEDGMHDGIRRRAIMQLLQ